MTNTPKLLRLRGTQGRIPRDQWGKADVVRVPSGPSIVLSHQEASLRVIEAAIRLHGIEEVLLEGPWDFHRQGPLATARQLEAYFTDTLRDAALTIERAFPQLQITTRFDDDRFAAIDWQTPPIYARLYHHCMDPRLDHLICRVRDRHPGQVMITRWPGGSAALVDSPFRQCLEAEYRLVHDFLIARGSLPPKIIPTGHEGCAYLQLAHDPAAEMAKHTVIARQVIDLIKGIFPVAPISARHITLNGAVCELSAA